MDVRLKVNDFVPTWLGPHFNVRPQSDTRHGRVPGTKPHYP
jgi:hypothetical protein